MSKERLDRLADDAKATFKDLADLPPDKFNETMEFALIATYRGWGIKHTSCHCGSGYAWWSKDPDGTESCHGCICHRSLKELAN